MYHFTWWLLMLTPVSAYEASPMQGSAGPHTQSTCWLSSDFPWGCLAAKHVSLDLLVKTLLSMFMSVNLPLPACRYMLILLPLRACQCLLADVFLLRVNCFKTHTLDPALLALALPLFALLAQQLLTPAVLTPAVETYRVRHACRGRCRGRCRI